MPHPRSPIRRLLALVVTLAVFAAAVHARAAHGCCESDGGPSSSLSTVTGGGPNEPTGSSGSGDAEPTCTCISCRTPFGRSPVLSLRPVLACATASAPSGAPALPTFSAEIFRPPLV